MDFVLLDEECKPMRVSNQDAGFDLRSSIDVKIYPGEHKVVPLGVAISIPEGMFGLLTHRSSLAFKHGCIISTGIIDSSFTSEIKALVINLAEEERPLVISKGDRIAQLILIDCNAYVRLNQVKSLEPGKEGFGSTGVN